MASKVFNISGGGGSSGGGGGIALGGVTNIQTVVASGAVYFKWTDPENIVVAGATLATWKGTLLVRKVGSYPVNRRDGEVVGDFTTKNSHEDTYFGDSGLTNGQTYYYKFFPYTTNGVYTDDAASQVEATPGAIPVGQITGLSGIAAGNGKAAIKWTDPAPTVSTDGITQATWGKTVVILKSSGNPTGPDDAGDFHQEITTRNAHTSTPLIATGLTNGTSYHIGVFTVTTDGAASAGVFGTVTPDRLVIATVPSQDTTTPLKYTGSAQTPIFKDYDTAKMTIAVTAQTNAGNYTASVTPLDDYKWSDGSITAKSIPWSIGRKAIAKVTAATKSWTYDGAAHIPTWAGYDADAMAISGITAGQTEVGNYSTSFTPDGNHEWTDGTTTAVKIDWSVTVRSIAAPSADETSLAYTGSSQMPVFTYDSTYVTIGGDSVAKTDVGSYTTTFTLKSTKNTKWADDTTAPKSITWNIQPKSVTKVTASTKTWTYDKNSHLPAWAGYDPDTMTISGDTVAQTDVGNFSTTFTLKGNYEWDDGTNTPLTINWSITARSLAVPTASPTSFTYNGNAQVPTFTYDSNYVTIGGDSAAKTAAGNYSATFTLDDIKNTKWADNSTSAKSVAWTINKASVAIPTVSGDKTYNGSEQTVSLSGYDSTKMTLSGTQKATNAGTYTVTATLLPNYQWSNGSTAAQDISWTIKKAAGSLTLSKSSVTLNGTTLSDTVTVTRSGNGVITVETSDSTVATATVSGTTVTINNVNKNTGTATITVKVAAGDNYEAPANKTVSVTAQFLPSVGTALEAMSWSDVKQIADQDLGANYFKVGDRKSVKLNGTVGTKSYNNVTLYTFILGFNHNATLEGNHLIHFAGFKTAATGGVDVCLDDGSYNSYKTDGSKIFNMNHWGNYNYGGWAACDMRYDILGSTNQAPSGYGSARVAGATGTNPTATCATSPVANTLMAALPSDLRAVMQPITKYSDAVGNSSNVAANVKATIDYLPLLAEFEVHGARTYANQYEKDKQAQYAYFSAGNSKVFYRQSTTGTAAWWWNRSAIYGNANSFCIVHSNGTATTTGAYISGGVLPAFAV